MNSNNLYGQPKSPTNFMSSINNSPFEYTQNTSILNDYDRLIKAIYDSIVAEASKAKFYTKLLEMVPNEMHHKIIEHTRNEELKHMKSFTSVYTHLVGHIPHIKLEPLQLTSYKDGILTSIKGKIEAVDLYREIQQLSEDPFVRETFYLAMIDEMEHANHLGELYYSLN